MILRVAREFLLLDLISSARAKGIRAHRTYDEKDCWPMIWSGKIREITIEAKIK
jgi:hypothetical protein